MTRRAHATNGITLDHGVALTTVTYDPADNVTVVQGPNGQFDIATFDALNRKVNTFTELFQQTTISYDVGSNVLSIEDPRSHVTSFGYDAFDRQTQVIQGYQLPDPDKRQYTNTVYDAADNALSVTDPLGKTTLFFYDGLNRRDVTIDARGARTTTTFDPNGNVLTLTLSKRWLEARPLVRADLEGELDDMIGLGVVLRLETA